MTIRKAEERDIEAVCAITVAAWTPIYETYRRELEDVLTALTARGADCFILGCTELPPAFRLLGLDAPVIDPTEELAKAAIRFCGYHVKGEP